MKTSERVSISVSLLASSCLCALPGITVAQGAKSPVSSVDRAFVDKASKAGTAEVAMGNLASANASSADVKTFAAKMVSDHTDANTKLSAIAQREGISISDQPTEADAREIKRLDSLTGGQFDEEYVKVQLKAHKDAVSLFKKEANSGHDPALKDFAATTLPTLQDHLAMVTMLSKSGR